MTPFSFTSSSSQETAQSAKNLARYLKAGDILCLFGDLGTGKTTFIKGLAQALNVKEKDVNSPTFVLMNIYEGKLPLYHFDLYRLDNPREISRLGYEEFFYNDGVSVVEWAEKLGGLLPEEHLAIELTHEGRDKRRITLKARGARYEKILSHLEFGP